MNARNCLAGLFVFILAFVDQAIKYAVIAWMDLEQYIEIMPFFALYHVQNHGIAFSMLASFNDWGLVALTILVIGFVFSLWWKVRQEPFLYHCGYLFVLGGALGNLIDRLRFHYVTDYIYISYGEGGWSFAVFNLADVFITLGAGGIIMREFLIWRSHKQQA